MKILVNLISTIRNRGTKIASVTSKQLFMSTRSLTMVVFVYSVSGMIQQTEILTTMRYQNMVQQKMRYAFNPFRRGSEIYDCLGFGVCHHSLLIKNKHREKAKQIHIWFLWNSHRIGARKSPKNFLISHLGPQWPKIPFIWFFSFFGGPWGPFFKKP